MTNTYDAILAQTRARLGSLYDISNDLFNKSLNMMVEKSFIEKQVRLESEGKEFLEYED